MSEIQAAVVAFFYSAKLDIILALIVVDVALALAVAMRTKEFEPRRLADFLLTMVLPYVFVYLVIDVTIGLVPALNGVLGQGINLLVFGAIVASLSASIYENFKCLDIKLPGQAQTQGGRDGPAQPGKTSSSNTQWRMWGGK